MKTCGNLTIEKATITTTQNGAKCINNNGKLEIVGGKIISEGANSNAIYNNKSETIIESGTIEVKGEGSKGIYNNLSLVIHNSAGTKSAVKIIVSADGAVGIYNSKEATVCNIKSAEILIKADEIENYETIKNTDEFKAKLEKIKPSYGIYNNSNIPVNIEEIVMKVERLKAIGILNNAEGKIVMGKKDEILTEDSPIIYATSDNTIAIVNANAQKGKVEFYDGSFVTTKSVADQITDVLENYEIFEFVNNGTIKCTLRRKEE